MAKEDNSSIAADKKSSPLKVSYSSVTCLEAITKAKMQFKKILIRKHFLKGSTLKLIGTLYSLDK